VLDTQVAQVTQSLLAAGLSDPGNLKSNKRKDVKMRLRCLHQLLQVREKDFSFREQVSDKIRRLQMDKEV